MSVSFAITFFDVNAAPWSTVSTSFTAIGVSLIGLTVTVKVPVSSVSVPSETV